MIAYGIKEIENRTWKTDYRGKLLIHASGLTMIDILDHFYPDKIIDLYNEYCDLGLHGKVTESEKFLDDNPPLRKIQELDYKIIAYKKEKKLFLQSQAIIGEAELIDIVRDSDSMFAEKNCYHWIIQNAIAYDKPVLNVKGSLKLWNFDIDRITF
jgi:hypothetical protein